MGDTPYGAELSPDFAGNLRGSDQRGKNSGARREFSDPRLSDLMEVWGTLSEDVKAEILWLAGRQPDDVDDLYESAQGGPFAARRAGVFGADETVP
jgi:hypothetical protein